MSVLAEYERYDGLGLAELVHRREVKPEEVLDEAIARIEARNPAINAVVTRLYDQARAAIAAHPAMSVPLGMSSSGLPLGVQFAARFGDEATLFRLAAQLEAARPWAARRPPVAGLA
jgi:Asp-tRNA(Asn)/Glu-tRNA(Gln) amidotransferase A subunit family amidase